MKLFYLLGFVFWNKNVSLIGVVVGLVIVLWWMWKCWWILGVWLYFCVDKRDGVDVVLVLVMWVFVGVFMDFGLGVLFMVVVMFIM